MNTSEKKLEHTIIDNASENFYKIHESEQNRLLMKAMLWFFVCVPVFFLGKLFGLFPEVNYPYFCFLLLIYLLGGGAGAMVFRNNPYSAVVKYILLITVEAEVFLISSNKGFEAYISYVIVPLLSCLFLNMSFCVQMMILSYLTMIACIILRAIFVVPTYEQSMNPMEWGLAYGIGLTIEMIINVVILIILNVRNRHLIDSDYKNVLKKLRTQNTITSSYVAMLSQKHAEIEPHLKRCSEYVRIMCKKLQRMRKYEDVMTDENMFCMITSTLMHDIGIISISDDILNKKTPLTPEERRILDTHPVLGKILVENNISGMEDNYMKMLLDVVLYHHEKWNGTGFPEKLSGNNIPLSARILAVANTFDDMTTEHSYKKSVSFEEGMELVKNMAGNELDPELALLFYESRNEVRKVYENMR